MFVRVSLFCLALLWASSAGADSWLVNPREVILLNSDQVSGVNEMSGIAYVGPNGSGMHRFLAVQDSGDQLVKIDLEIDANGSLSSATAIDTLALSPGYDFEGIVYNGSTKNSVYLSEENTPGVREYNLVTGMESSSLATPGVFGNRRLNRGFESLARDSRTGTIWTANEEALTIDGPTATTTAGTYVRLQQFVEGGEGAIAGAQFAYYVEPIHVGTTVNSNTRSGLVELVSLPDGSLLSLERSLAYGLPPFLSRIYQLDFTEATDISSIEFDSGLVGKTFSPVEKSLLWSGSVGGLFGQNLEGLSLGPQLSNGNWSLIGVVDSGDDLSSNAIVAFELTSRGCGPVGDYNCDQSVNGTDYAAWKNAFAGMGSSYADGNRDGIINAADYVVWRDHTAPVMGTAATAVPEPRFAAWGFFLLASIRLWRKHMAAALSAAQRPLKRSNQAPNTGAISPADARHPSIRYSQNGLLRATGGIRVGRARRESQASHASLPVQSLV